MSLDWERCKTILKRNNDSLLDIIQHQDYLKAFFTRLLRILKETETANACAELYPEAGPLLTLASTHSYIGYNPLLASLVIACLIEYSKLDPDTLQDKTFLSRDDSKYRSIIWCIIRLRRFIHTAQDDLNTYDLIKQITHRISDKKLSSHTITRLTDMSLALVHEKEAWPLIEKLVYYAVDHIPFNITDPVHFNKPEPILSILFIDSLTNPDSILRTLYLQWPHDLKIKLYMNYEQVLEMEVLNLIERYLRLQTDCYEPLDHLYRTMLENEDIIQVLTSYPTLIHLFFDTFLMYLAQFRDWRIVRIGQCCILCLLFEQRESTDYNNLVRLLACKEWRNDAYSDITDYIYAGSKETMLLRRDMAWCLSLTSFPFLYRCIFELVEWNRQKSERWTSKMENELIYINWVIYPSMDVRQSQSLSDLRSWIQFSLDLYHDLPKIWRTLLNSNGSILACFMIALLDFYSDIEEHTALYFLMITQMKLGLFMSF
ncbi:uncharacterized protein BX663DRAFT_550586 [Cokeromyces recurvatus]|uniref:uncharacterized protein n=1 Tax=Cokeromyces recurvatus TaxID=90255 RepID=UPI0022208452|nr:uncharacterized protein BX663DRAFT_550586 [Cokeromyces recurvatus]KAI7904187.1 hypothetical protein BX663DRAFT_550586 [Cokeromyces recurvatus]